jgi:AcrR family transcriptional regulator
VTEALQSAGAGSLPGVGPRLGAGRVGASKSSRAERTHERIVEVGFAAIRRVGIRRMAMEAVADQAGVSRAALYRHFPNKQALVDEVLETNARRWRQELTRLLEGKRTLEAKVGAAARFGHFPPRDLMLLGLTETDPESLAMLLTTGAHRFLERATRFWEPHVREAKRRDEVGRAVDAREGAEWIARCFFSLATIPALTFDASEPAAFERHAKRFIMGGLHGK